MNKNPTIRPLPDNPDEDSALMENLVNVISGADRYWENRVELAFMKAGFAIQRIQREEYHQTVWTAWLTQTNSLALPKNNHEASKQLRNALKKCGLTIKARELTVLEQCGEKLKCVFLFGSVGPSPEI